MRSLRIDLPRRRKATREPALFDSLYTCVMASRFRTALMWLLLLALPLQGFAAATMLHCGPNHHGMSAESHDHTISGHRPHEAGIAGDPHEMATDDGGTDSSAVRHLNKLAKFKCSACAACCMGVALPTAALAFAPIPPAMAPDSCVPTSHAGFVTDGPDRPPRLSLV